MPGALDISRYYAPMRPGQKGAPWIAGRLAAGRAATAPAFIVALACSAQPKRPKEKLRRLAEPSDGTLEPLRALWLEPARAPEWLVAALHYLVLAALGLSRLERFRLFSASASSDVPRPSATSRQWLSGLPPRVVVYSSRRPLRYGQRAPSSCVRDAQHHHLEAGRPDAAEFDRWVSDPSRVSHGLAWGTRVLHTVFQAKR